MGILCIKGVFYNARYEHMYAGYERMFVSYFSIFIPYAGCERTFERM